MSVPDRQFTAEQEPQIEAYHPLSGLAVAALLLGLLSPLGIMGEFTVAVPLAAAAVSAVAWWRIHASQGDLSGRTLAAVGLILGLFFGAWAVTEVVARRSMVASQAKRFCDGWLRLLADDKAYEAFQWTRALDARLDPAAALEIFYRDNEDGRNEFSNFFASTPFQVTGRRTTLRDFEYRGNQSITQNEFGEDVIAHRYRLTYERDGKSRTSEVILTVYRFRASDAKFIHWRLHSIRPADQGARAY